MQHLRRVPVLLLLVCCLNMVLSASSTDGIDSGSEVSPGAWGQGYAEYDLYNNAQCSGTPMPGARTLGCFKSMEGQCVTSTIMNLKLYTGGFNESCCSDFRMLTVAAGQCIPAPGSDGSLYIKAKSCAKTGAVPMQIDMGYCTDTYSNNDCSGDLQLSECYATDTCLRFDKSYATKFKCTSLLYHTAGENVEWRGTSCDGEPVAVDALLTNKCYLGQWLHSCTVPLVDETTDAPAQLNTAPPDTPAVTPMNNEPIATPPTTPVNDVNGEKKGRERTESPAPSSLSTSSSTTADDSSASISDLKTMLIVAIGVGCLILVALVAAVVVVCFKRVNRDRHNSSSPTKAAGSLTCNDNRMMVWDAKAIDRL